MSVRDLPRDTIVDQRYSIVSRIGAGGMAEVYSAQDLQLGRKVALKLLHRRFSEDPDFVERFRREASSAAGLQHPNVVGVYDRGEWDGTYYIAMEFLEGRSLKELVAAGPLEPERAIDIVVQILRAARFAHQRGVIHRDLKPHNVIVDDEGRVKVTDFGIARAGASDMTETGSIMGTAQYLSPEQAQGHAVSARSDLYAIGIVLYELLAGQVPFDGDSPVTIALKQVSEAPVPPSAYNPAVPPELDAVVLRALEKDPAERFADADEFMAALEHVRAGLTVAAGQSTAAFGAVPYPATAPTDAAVAPLPAAVPLSDEELAAAAYPEEPLPPDHQPERDWRRWLIATGLAALVIVGLLALLALRPERVPVPNVVGTQLSAASTVLRNAGFDVEIERVVDPAPRDRVLRQDPQPETEVAQGSTVTLRVSDGPQQTAVPDVSRLPRDDAVDALTKAGFKVKVEEESSDAIPRGQATRTAPPGGSQTAQGSTITLYVSSGPGEVEVPDVVGQSEASASAELGRAGLEVSVSRQDAESPAGTVLSQDPGGGTSVDRGSSVSIVVAREPSRVSVPSVVGQDEDSARATLEAAGFGVSVQTTPVSSAGQDGIVVDQDPGGGDRATRGRTVTIEVGEASRPPGGQAPQQPGQ